MEEKQNETKSLAVWFPIYLNDLPSYLKFQQQPCLVELLFPPWIAIYQKITDLTYLTTPEEPLKLCV